MITRNAFFGEDLTPEEINKITKAIGNRWELVKGSGWTDEYYIYICTFSVDGETDCLTEAHADLYECDLIEILEKIGISYSICQY